MTILNARGRVIALALTGAIAGFAAAGAGHFSGLAQNGGGTQGSVYGPFGPEGARLREQLWIVPGADPRTPLRATVFRPPSAVGLVDMHVASTAARLPLVVINHGSDEDTRVAVSMPVFYWLSKWFVDRGYVVVLPQRRGHGATGGEWAESRDSCADPDHFGAGITAADDIESAVRYMVAQPFIDPSQTVVVGISTGGWGALALAARNPPGIRLVVNFAGGRGGHAYGAPRAVCRQERLIDAAGAYGRTARVPTLWFYSENDSYFSPELAAAMARSWQSAGGLADLHVLPRHHNEGHALAADRAGWELWGDTLERSLAHARHRGMRTAHRR
jgi:dienelactone hydrolase